MKDAYTKSSDEVVKILNSYIDGLTANEVKARLNKYGYNEIEAKKPKTILEMILEQLKDRMILILLLASILSFILGEYAEGIVILIIIFINTLISIIEEKKALDAIEALRNMNAPHTTVIRDGKKKNILTKEVVIGDIVYLEDGNIVPADIRLIEENGLKVDESSLTGESVPVEKDANIILDKNTTLADRVNMVYSSTIISYGTAIGVVVGTATNTEVGSIATMLEDTDSLDTPLKRKLNKVGEVLSIIGILVAILIFIIGLLYDKDFISLLMVSISLAISVIPEGLPATATIVMALGVSRMAKKNALVKKLPAVEALGSATVICSDKTGTLTLNKMTVVKSTLYSDIINKNDENTFSDDLIKCSLICNNAYIDKDKVIGDPTEGCLLTYAKNNGYDIKDIKSNKVLYEQAFDSIRKRMSVVIKDKKEYLLYCKGAPEELIDVCSYACVDDKLVKLTNEDKDKIKDYCVTMSSKGLRLLGFAMKNIKTLPKEGDMIEEDLTFIGIMGIIDPPRVEVKHAINTCHEAGIRVIMITGDHKLTATAIAKDLGIYKKGDLVVDGEELSRMSDLKLRNTIKDISVFARVTPQDKLRIVNALKKKKEIVAMTGDGVNDAPALKKADIGVAMGITGTDVAKDAAAMILLDDNFTTIEAAVKEGRRVYRNIQKVIQYLLAGNIAEVLTIFTSMLFNLPSPLLAVHILFINLVTDTLPSLALGIDPVSPNVMKHKPVKEGSLFEKGLVFRIGFYGIFLAIITLIAYLIGSNDSYDVGMTMAFTVLCLSQIFHSLNQSSSITSLFSKDYPRNKMLFLSMVGSIIFLLIVLFVTPIREFFSLSVLNGNEWLIVILLSLSPILIVEIFKAIKRSLGMDS
ncbi:MAG TPA: calcium-translocating P-type ATPase, PMCA-type [Candidatus Onthousia excrementipullorum]|uniref:P-type Ca(2+) transporter n=1 Tax=Candidatus Onthousia excrementipullorum TaxID=2840884 RepID=A0A9D1J3X3_9FIRM|nr:calcium-translocating P-type ATPase, PMCA-type [Candidatus Onthousia excrementipullorum]